MYNNTIFSDANVGHRTNPVRRVRFANAGDTCPMVQAAKAIKIRNEETGHTTDLGSRIADLKKRRIIRRTRSYRPASEIPRDRLRIVLLNPDEIDSEKSVLSPNNVVMFDGEKNNEALKKAVIGTELEGDLPNWLS